MTYHSWEILWLSRTNLFVYETVTRLVMCHQSKAGCAGIETGRTQDAGGAEGAARMTTAGAAGVFFILSFADFDNQWFFVFV